MSASAATAGKRGKITRRVQLPEGNSSSSCRKVFEMDGERERQKEREGMRERERERGRERVGERVFAVKKDVCTCWRRPDSKASVLKFAFYPGKKKKDSKVLTKNLNFSRTPFPPKIQFFCC